MNIIHAGKDEPGSVEAVVLAFTSLKFYLESFFLFKMIDNNCWVGVEWVSVFKLSEGWFDGKGVMSALKRWRWRGSLHGGKHR